MTLSLSFWNGRLLPRWCPRRDGRNRRTTSLVLIRLVLGLVIVLCATWQLGQSIQVSLTLPKTNGDQLLTNEHGTALLQMEKEELIRKNNLKNKNASKSSHINDRNNKNHSLFDVPQVQGHRPIIYTYRSKWMDINRDNNIGHMDRSANTTASGAESSSASSMLSLWKHEWQRAGWTTIILTDSDIASSSWPLHLYGSNKIKSKNPNNHDETVARSISEYSWQWLRNMSLDFQLEHQHHSFKTRHGLSGYNAMLFRRWMALSSFLVKGKHPVVATGNEPLIWYADVHVLPLTLSQTRHIQEQGAIWNQTRKTTNCLVLLERVAPSFAVGTPHAWLGTTHRLLQSLFQRVFTVEAQQQSNDDITNDKKTSNHTNVQTVIPQTATQIPRSLYWTDSLALQLDVGVRAPNSICVENRVVSVDRIPVTLPTPDKNSTASTPASLNATTEHSLFCRQRWIRNKWAIHVSPRHLPTLAQTDLYKRLFDEEAHVQQISAAGYPDQPTNHTEATAVRRTVTASKRKSKDSVITPSSSLMTPLPALVLPHQCPRVAQALLAFLRRICG